MTRQFTTAPADTARAMHAAEMKGQDMQDAPERIYRQPGFKAEFVTAIPFERAAIPATAYITEAECQRRIDAAIDDLMKALRAADTYIDIGHFQMARNITRNAIRARGQK